MEVVLVTGEEVVAEESNLEMKGFKDNIEELTLKNKDFRNVLYTGEHSQLVLMSLKPGEEVGLEVHPDNDQFFRFEAGQAEVTVDNTLYTVGEGDAVIVPRGAEHNVVNTSPTEHLKFYTIYSPPHHVDGIVRETREEAITNEAEFDGMTTE
jgi:mannose-6-phosphate isomerase-like protein (cupin superfamily)